MVLVHGVGLRSEVWAPQVTAFSTSYRVIVYDTLGHGGSDPPPESASLECYVTHDDTLPLPRLDGEHLPKPPACDERTLSLTPPGPRSP